MSAIILGRAAGARVICATPAIAVVAIALIPVRLLWSLV